MQQKFFTQILLAAALIAISACAMNPTEDRFTAEELKPSTQLQSELAAVNSELSTVNAQLTNAESRLNSYKVQTALPQNAALIENTQVEISNYQNQKSTLTARQQELNAQLSLVQ